MKSIIPPHIEYVSVVWQPVNPVAEIRKMKNPLRSFTRIPELRNLPYYDRLKIIRNQPKQRRSE